MSFLRPFYSLPQPPHVTESHPSPSDNQKSKGGCPKEHRASKNGHVKLIQFYLHQGSPLFSIFRAASTVIPLLPKAYFTPSIQPNLCLPRTDLHLLPPSTPFWPYGTHPFFPHAQTISILSDPLSGKLHKTHSQGMKVSSLYYVNHCVHVSFLLPICAAMIPRSAQQPFDIRAATLPTSAQQSYQHRGSNPTNVGAAILIQHPHSNSTNIHAAILPISGQQFY